MSGVAEDGTARARPFSGLRLRFVSGVVLLVAGVGVVLAGGWVFVAAVAVVAGLMANEWMSLVSTGTASGPVRALPAAGLVVAVFAAGADQPLPALAVVLATSGAAALSRGLSRGPDAWAALGMLWLGIPCVAAIWLRHAGPDGAAILLWVLATVWAMDIGAFFTGRLLRGPLLWPRVSPNKTWSGAIGGLAAAAAVGAAASPVTGLGGAAAMAGISLLLAAFSHLGDLAESATKRHFHRKDSGGLIPGHGGILDRLDAQLFAVALAAAIALANGGTLLPWR